MSTDSRVASASRGWLLLAVVFGVYFLWRGWGRWSDVLVDFGRELYVPWRLVEGELLGVDLAWFNGPLSPHVNALLFRLFGVGYWTLVWANVLWLVVIVVVLYRLLGRVGSPTASGVAITFFLAVFAFGHLVPIGNYNFISPYSHELTHGTGLALLALACLQRDRGARTILAGLLLGLVFLTKVEIFAAALVGCVVTLTLREDRVRSLARLFSGALVMPILALGLLALRAPVASALDLVVGPYLRIQDARLTELAYYRQGLGLDDPATHLGEMAFGLGCLALALLPGLLIARLPAARRRAVPVAGALFVLGVVAWTLLPTSFRWLARSSPAVLVLIALVSFLARRRASGDERGRHGDLIGLCAFAFVLLGKILLQVRFGHYGFALAAPALCLVVATLLGPLARWWGGGERAGALVVGAPALALVLVSGATQWRKSDAVYRTKTVPVGEGRDAIWTDGRGELVSEALRQVESRLSQEDELVVLPEGITINYLSRRRTPTPYVNFMPPEMILFGEASILSALEARPPRAVLLVHKDTSEYGVPLFGTDYAESIGAWVLREYRHRWTDPRGGAPLMPGTEFGISLLERAP